jgi:creatinine amidohydrolase
VLHDHQVRQRTWPEFGNVIARDADAIVPIGATEQHGQHLTTATAVVLPVALADAVAPARGFLVAPPLVCGCRSRPLSGGGESFPGTTSLSARTFTPVRCAVITLSLSTARVAL